jgi:hypothetical protein
MVTVVRVGVPAVELTTFQIYAPDGIEVVAKLVVVVPADPQAVEVAKSCPGEEVAVEVV